MAEGKKFSDETGLEASIEAIQLSPTLTNDEIRKEQLRDGDIKPILQWKEESDIRPQWKEVSHYSSSVKTYWINWNLLEIKDGILVRRWESNDGKDVNWKIVLPKPLRPKILEELITRGQPVTLE